MEPAPDTNQLAPPIERPQHATPCGDADELASLLGHARRALLEQVVADDQPWIVGAGTDRMLSVTVPLRHVRIRLDRLARCLPVLPAIDRYMDAARSINTVVVRIEREGGVQSGTGLARVLEYLEQVVRELPAVPRSARYELRTLARSIDDAGVAGHERSAPHAWIVARHALLRSRVVDEDFDTSRPARFSFNAGAQRLFADPRFERLHGEDGIWMRPPWTRSYQESISAFANGLDRTLAFEHEADNPYDRYAVVVVGRFRTPLEQPGQQREAVLGHLTRETAYEVHRLLEDGHAVVADWLLTWWRGRGISASWRALLAIDHLGEATPLPLRAWERDRPGEVSVVRTRARSRARASERTAG